MQMPISRIEDLSTSKTLRTNTNKNKVVRVLHEREILSHILRVKKLQVFRSKLLKKISSLVKNDVGSLGYYVTRNFFVTCTGHLTPSQVTMNHNFTSLHC
jgi:hypothetical protein